MSVVVPVLDAGRDLAGCLEAIGAVDELIVVDGGSSDDSVAIAKRCGARVIDAPRGRGLQLAAGAAAASSEWMLFLHADTRLAPGWVAEAMAHMDELPEIAAAFRFALDDLAWQARLIERGVAARVALLGLPYGDQGLLIPRSLYDAVGGYRPLPLMEDVDLVRRIGRRRLRALTTPAVTSAERWRRDGWLRRSGRNLGCLALYALGVPPARIARLYA